jgi:hypothetical protein
LRTMIETVLQHCDNRCVYPVKPGDPPLGGLMTVSAGGAAGDGTVTVTTKPPKDPPVPIVSTGGLPVSFDATGVTEVWMHYEAAPDGPQQVEVTMGPPQ